MGREKEEWERLKNKVEWVWKVLVEEVIEGEEGGDRVEGMGEFMKMEG